MMVKFAFEEPLSREEVDDYKVVSSAHENTVVPFCYVSRIEEVGGTVVVEQILRPPKYSTLGPAEKALACSCIQIQRSTDSRATATANRNDKQQIHHGAHLRLHDTNQLSGAYDEPLRHIALCTERPTTFSKSLATRDLCAGRRFEGGAHGPFAE